jgi:hypothetical protein
MGNSGNRSDRACVAHHRVDFSNRTTRREVGFANRRRRPEGMGFLSTRTQLFSLIGGDRIGVKNIQFEMPHRRFESDWYSTRAVKYDQKLCPVAKKLLRFDDGNGIVVSNRNENRNSKKFRACDRSCFT